MNNKIIIIKENKQDNCEEDNQENKKEDNLLNIRPKRQRKHSAQKLPQGLEQNMMRKYVVYYREWIDSKHTKEREYFKIEKHPMLKKSWTSSKSNKITLQEKLQEANKMSEKLDKEYELFLMEENKKNQTI
jgi:hypothetical protein